MSLLFRRRACLAKSCNVLLKASRFSLVVASQISVRKVQYVRPFSIFTPSTRRKKVEPFVAEPDWDFLEEAKKCIKAVSIALEPMMELNEEFKLNTTDDELILDVGPRGQVVLSVDTKQECLCLSTPISGVFEYLYDVETGQWLGSVDRHDMRGMITRDLLRHFRGMPNF